MTKKQKRADCTENQRIYLETLERSELNYRKARAAAGVSRETLSRWRETEEFQLEEDRVRGEVEAELLKHLRAHYKKNLGAVIFKLKQVNAEEYDEDLRAAKVKAAALTDPEKFKPVTVILQRQERQTQKTDEPIKLVKG